MTTIRDLLRKAWLAGVLSATPVAAATPPDCTDFNDNDRLESHDRQWCQALAFRQSYMERGRFVEKPPGHDGTAHNVSRKLATHFSSNGNDGVRGTVTIGTLRGRLRLKLARTDNYSYYGRKIGIAGLASTGEGRLEIYSRVDVDLWQLAAVLVDDPVRGAPPPQDGLVLKGYLVTEILPGSQTPFRADLIPMGADFMLLLNAPDGTAKDIRIEIADK